MQEKWTFANGKVILKNVYDNLIRANKIFKTNVFSCKDLQAALSITKSRAESLIGRGLKGEFLFQIASKRDLDDLFDCYDCVFSAIYSFDKSKDFKDAVNYFDLEPIPENEISLEVQLTGDTYQRYLDVRNKHVELPRTCYEE